MEIFEPINILLLIKELVETTVSKQEIIKQLEIISGERKLDKKQLIKIYEKMVLFSEEMEAIGGIDKYRLSNINWLKTELELIVECCQFCSGESMRLTDIFYQISNEQASIVPKTPSQITYIYYQIKKHNQPLERILRKKVGRKRKVEKGAKEQKSQEKQVLEEKKKETHSLNTEHSEINFMKLLSGTMNNLAAIYQSQDNKNNSLYHLVEEIYHLSSIGGQNSERTKEYERIKIETKALRHQQEALIDEREKIVRDFRVLVDCVQKFINSPEMTQIIMLPKFINDSKEVLEKLELIISKENRNT